MADRRNQKRYWQIVYRKPVPAKAGIVISKSGCLPTYPILQNKANFKRAKMNLNLSFIKDCKHGGRLAAQKKQTQSKPNGGLWPEIRNKMNGCQMTAPEAQLKRYHLKKQSQFAPGRIGAKSYLKGDYDNKPTLGGHKNEAKQSQSQPSLREREKAGAGKVAVLK